MVKAQAQADCPRISGTDAIVALGANLPAGDLCPADAVSEAMDRLDPADHGVRSRLFRTPAFPPGSGPDFVNAAIRMSWPESADALLMRLHAIEAEFGRTRSARWEARRMDLDLIAYGEAVLPDLETQSAWAGLAPNEAAERMPDRLIVPHPRLAERPFVLVPMADIAPDWVHPVTGQSVTQMLAACPAEDRAGVVALG